VYRAVVEFYECHSVLLFLFFELYVAEVFPNHVPMEKKAIFAAVVGKTGNDGRHNGCFVVFCMTKLPKEDLKTR
jgi:hypothetical protein